MRAHPEDEYTIAEVKAAMLARVLRTRPISQDQLEIVYRILEQHFGCGIPSWPDKYRSSHVSFEEAMHNRLLLLNKLYPDG